MTKKKTTYKTFVDGDGGFTVISTTKGKKGRARLKRIKKTRVARRAK